MNVCVTKCTGIAGVRHNRKCDTERNAVLPDHDILPEASASDSHSDGTKLSGDPQRDKLAARASGYAGYRISGWKLLEKYSDKRVYLSEMIEGRTKGRSSDDEITLSPSPAGGSALSVRFCVLVPMVYEEARRCGIGQDLPDEWFHQEAEAYPLFQLE